MTTEEPIQFSSGSGETGRCKTFIFILFNMGLSLAGGVRPKSSLVVTQFYGYVYSLKAKDMNQSHVSFTTVITTGKVTLANPPPPWYNHWENIKVTFFEAFDKANENTIGTLGFCMWHFCCCSLRVIESRKTSWNLYSAFFFFTKTYRNRSITAFQLHYANVQLAVTVWSQWIYLRGKVEQVKKSNA